MFMVGVGTGTGNAQPIDRGNAQGGGEIAIAATTSATFLERHAQFGSNSAHSFKERTGHASLHGRAIQPHSTARATRIARLKLGERL